MLLAVFKNDGNYYIDNPLSVYSKYATVMSIEAESFEEYAQLRKEFDNSDIAFDQRYRIKVDNHTMIHGVVYQYNEYLIFDLYYATWIE